MEQSFDEKHNGDTHMSSSSHDFENQQEDGLVTRVAVANIANFVQAVRNSCLRQSSLQNASAASYNVNPGLRSGTVKHTFGTSGVRSTEAQKHSAEFAKQAVGQHLIHTDNLEEQELGQEVVQSALEAEAAAIRSRSWQYIVSEGSASVVDDATVAERQARDKARQRLVQLLGPALGYTPESAGNSHVPRPLRLRRDAAAEQKSCVGPSSHAVPGGVVSSLRPYLYSTGARKANLKWAQASDSSHTGSTGSRRGSAQTSRRGSATGSAVSPTTPVSCAGPVVAATCTSGSGSGNGYVLPRVIVRIRHPEVAESKGEGEDWEDSVVEPDDALSRLGKLLHGDACTAYACLGTDGHLDSVAVVPALPCTGDSDEEEEGEGEEDSLYDYDSDGSAPGRLQSSVDPWIVAGVKVCMDFEGKEGEDDEDESRGRGLARRASQASDRRDTPRASSAPPATFASSLQRLYSGDAPRPSGATPVALGVWMRAQRDKARAQASRHFHEDLARSLAHASMASARGRSNSRSSHRGRSSSGQDLPSPYPADAVRTLHTPTVRIKPLDGALLSDQQWFKLCLVRAREARGRARGVALPSSDSDRGVRYLEPRAHSGVRFGRGTGTGAGCKSPTTSACEMAVQEAARRRKIHESMTSLRMAERRLRLAKLEQQQQQQQQQQQRGGSGRSASPAAQDTSYPRERRGTGRPPTDMQAQVDAEAHAAAAKATGARRKRVRPQRTWYASQLHEVWGWGPSTATATGGRGQGEAIRAEIFAQSLPPRTAHAGMRRSGLPMGPLGKQVGWAEIPHRGGLLGQEGEGPAAYTVRMQHAHVPASHWGKGSGREDGPGPLTESQEVAALGGLMGLTIPTIPPLLGTRGRQSSAAEGREGPVLGRAGRRVSPGHRFGLSSAGRGTDASEACLPANLRTLLAEARGQSHGAGIRRADQKLLGQVDDLLERIQGHLDT